MVRVPQWVVLTRGFFGFQFALQTVRTKAVGTVPAAALAASAATAQEIFGKDHAAIFEIKIFALVERRAGGSFFLRLHEIAATTL